MTICYACNTEMPTAHLIAHWDHDCLGVRPFEKLAEVIAQPEPPLLAKAWEQIEDILVETGFVR